MVPTDYPAMIEFWNQCDGLGMSDADSEEGVTKFLQRNPGMSFVAEAHGKLIGTALGGTDGRRGFIYHLAVVPEFRKQGVARGLVDRCLQQLQAAGVQKCHIVVYANNYEGQKFWERIGWEKRDNLLIMSKMLPL